MSIGWTFLSTGIIILVAIIVSAIYIKLCGNDLFGGKKMGMAVGVLGAIVGGYLIDLFFQLSFLEWLHNIPYMQMLLVNRVDINFFASILGVWLFLRLYEYISQHT